jgi:Tol biopolymer transport system component
MAVTADGSVLFQGGERDVWRLARNGKVEPVLVGAAQQFAPALSPNGRWLAYSSDESGSPQVYICRYPSVDQATVVSTHGGTYPVWSRNGRELYYRQGDAVMAVPLEATDRLHVETPIRLFSGRYTGTARDPGFDVTPDGHFIMVKADPASELRTLSVVQNWFDAPR